jgi:hypothetical protein
VYEVVKKPNASLGFLTTSKDRTKDAEVSEKAFLSERRTRGSISLHNAKEISFGDNLCAHIGPREVQKR